MTLALKKTQMKMNYKDKCMQWFTSIYKNETIYISFETYLYHNKYSLLIRQGPINYAQSSILGPLYKWVWIQEKLEIKQSYWLR